MTWMERRAVSAMFDTHVLIAEIGALDLLVLANLGGRAGRDDPAIDQDRDAVGERKHRLHVVLDQHDRDLLAQLLEQLHHARGFGDAEAGHRLPHPPPLPTPPHPPRPPPPPPPP